MKTEYQYIIFVRLASTTKTSIWDVSTKLHNSIGTVAWYGPWRRYCFHPANATVFSADCLADIQDFIKQLMDARKVS